MRNLLRLAIGAAYIVIAASALGFTANILRPAGLPIIRKPLRQMLRPITGEQIRSHASLVEPTGTPATPLKPEPTVTIPPTPQPLKPSPPVPPKPNSTHPRPPVANPNKPAHPVKPPAPKPTPAKAEAGFTTMEDAKAFFDDKSALFLDARPADDYNAEHITGALSLYAEKLDELYESVLGNVPKDRLIVTYCSDPECKKAVKLADDLVAKGFTRVVIFLEGLPGWKQAGYPTVSGKEPGR